MTWPKRDMFAITVDGDVLINILAVDEDNPPPLALRRGVFVGVVLTEKEKRLLGEGVFDATSEVAALISGQRRRRRAAARRK
jgi:hypothetical protein